MFYLFFLPDRELIMFAHENDEVVRQIAERFVFHVLLACIFIRAVTDFFKNI